MKILFFSYAYPNPVNPGLATFNRTMIAGLADQHDLRVVSPVSFTEAWRARLLGRLPRGLNDTGFQAVPGVTAEYCQWYYTPKLFRNQYGRFMARCVNSTLNRVMNDFAPDMVLSYWTHPDGEVAVKTARQFGVPVVTIVGGSDVLINGRNPSRQQTILNVLREADGVVTVSDHIRRHLITAGIPTQKLHLVRRGIDRRIYHGGDQQTAQRHLGLPEDLPIIISVGRLVPVKGHTHLIEACRLLAQRGVQFRCYLLGEGPLRSQLQQQINQAGLTNTVQLCGSKTSNELADWYRAADLSVLSSLSEGVPNVLLESIACGTPFVASDVGGIPEIADEHHDRLVPPASPDKLADAMAARLATMPAVVDRARRFEPSSMNRSADSLANLLKSFAKPASVTSVNQGLSDETDSDDYLCRTAEGFCYQADS